MDRNTEYFLKLLGEQIADLPFTNEAQAEELSKKMGILLGIWLDKEGKKFERKILDKKFYDSYVRRQMKKPDDYIGSTEEYHVYRHNNAYFYTWADDIKIKGKKSLSEVNPEVAKIFGLINEAPPQDNYIDPATWKVMTRKIKKIDWIEFNDSCYPIGIGKEDKYYEESYDNNNTLAAYATIRLARTLLSAVDGYGKLYFIDEDDDKRSFMVLGTQWYGFVFNREI